MFRIASLATSVSLLFACQVRAELAPSFYLGFSAWRATNIVVVDSKGSVLENWKGDLPIGSKLPIEKWQLPTNEKVHYGYFENDPTLDPRSVQKDSVQRVSDARRILFLRRIDDGAPELAESWQGADMFKQIKTSVAWIEKNESFAMQQWTNPGPVLMRPLNLTETALHAEVDRLVELQQDMHNVAKERDPLARAERLVSFLRPDDRWIFLDALKELKNCGSAAWRVIRRLLTQDELLLIHSDLIHVAEKTAGTDAIGELERILGEDAQYWSRIVKSGQIPVSYNPPMSDHYDRLLSCLSVLSRLGYRDPQGLVAQLRADWDAIPALAHLGSGDGKGRSPILEYADQILAPK